MHDLVSNYSLYVLLVLSQSSTIFNDINKYKRTDDSGFLLGHVNLKWIYFLSNWGNKYHITL